MNEVVKFIEDHKTLVICRGIYGDDLLRLITALHAGGIMMAEVTFDQADPSVISKTGQAIKMLKENFPDMKIGSGKMCIRDSNTRCLRLGSSIK